MRRRLGGTHWKPDLFFAQSDAQSMSRMTLFLAVALSLTSSAAFGQFLQEVGAVKFGTGCVERLKAVDAGLGACMMGATRSRVWCPNGKVYERDGILPDMSLVRSVCGLNQLR